LEEQLAEALSRPQHSASRDRQLNLVTGQLAEALSRPQHSASRDRQLNLMTGRLAQSQAANEQRLTLSESLAAELSAKVEQLENDKQSLSEELRRSQDAVAQASATIDERDQMIQSQNEDWNDQKEHLLQQLDSQNRSLTQLNAAAASHQRDQSTILQLKTDLNQHKARFESELNGLKTAHDRELKNQVRTAGTDYHSARMELEHYQRQVAKLNLQLSQSKEREVALEQKQDLFKTQLQQAETEQNHVAKKQNEQLSSLRQTVEQEQLLRSQAVSELRLKLQTANEAHADAVSKLETIRAIEHGKKTESKTESLSRTTKPKAKRTASRKPKNGPSKKAADDKIGDDLTEISGIGPIAAKKLRKLGVKTFQQISQWTANDVQEFSAALSVGGRIKSERWVRQAKKLAR